MAVCSGGGGFLWHDPVGQGLAVTFDLLFTEHQRAMFGMSGTLLD
jgi:hypothetical protein